MTNQAKLKTLIDKINWLYNSFEENNFNNVSALEKALLKEKVLMFYDEVENISTQIQKETINNIVANKSEKTKIVENDTISSSMKEIENPKISKGEVFEKEIVKEEKIVEKPKPTIKDEPIVKKEETIFNKIDSIHKAALEKKEKFEKTKEFQRQIAMPKRDMREIIDLNKSFIFKAELFGQNNDLYNEFIDELNTSRNEESAFSIMINWTEKLNWNTEDNKAYDLLLKSVEKRFLPLI